MPILADTSALFALADVADREHGAVLNFIAALRDSVVVPVTVLPELDYLLADRLGLVAELAMLQPIIAGELRLEGFTPTDLQRSVELIEQYADNTIGLVDASIVAMAERLRITRILTLDHRHFRMFRPKHCAAFDLVP